MYTCHSNFLHCPLFLLSELLLIFFNSNLIDLNETYYTREYTQNQIITQYYCLRTF